MINQRRWHIFRAWLAERVGLSSTGLAAQALAKEEASPCHVWRQGKDRPSIVAYASSLFRESSSRRGPNKQGCLCYFAAPTQLIDLCLHLQAADLENSKASQQSFC